MNRRLSEGQMSEALGEALAAFRQSARQWSERELEAAAPDAWNMEKPRPWITFRSLRWACAAAMVFLFAGALMIWRSHQPAPVDSADADAMLLQQIDTDVSQAVPDSMEPLLKLVSWNAAPASSSKQN